jgi:hypothetical protein
MTNRMDSQITSVKTEEIREIRLICGIRVEKAVSARALP